MEDANGGEAGEKKQRQEEANTEEKKRIDIKFLINLGACKTLFK